MRQSAWPLLVVLTLSGCTGLGPEARDGVNEPMAAPLEWGYDCPPPPVRESASGVCVQTLGGPESFTAEPHVAIHPADSQVIAVGVNRIGGYVGAPAVDLASLSHPGLTLGLFVTEDGGASWRTPAVPVQPGKIHLGDPNLAFDGSGALHVTGLTQAVTGGPLEVFHVKTTDLGASWSSIAIVSDERGADRQWITIFVGEVFVTYQQSSIPASFIARSHDGGVTWEPPIAISSCNLNTEVVPQGDRRVMACSDAAGERLRIVDVAGAEPVDLAALPALYGYKRLAAATNGTLQLVVSGYSAITNSASILVYSSQDGGLSWSLWADMAALTDTLAGWTWSWVSWATVDQRDRLHVLATGGSGSECVRGACEDEATSRSHVHVVLDLAAGRLEHGARVSPESREDGGRDLDSPWPGLGDEASGIACDETGCVLAWGWDKAVDWTRIGIV